MWYGIRMAATFRLIMNTILTALSNTDGPHVALGIAHGTVAGAEEETILFLYGFLGLSITIV